MKTKTFLMFFIVFLPVFAFSQTFPVTFRYAPTYSPSVVYLSGSSNGWANSQSGYGSESQFEIADSDGDGTWTKMENLAPGSYMYKFLVDHNHWYSDPLNPLTNPADNNNSVLNVTDPFL